MPVLQHAQVVSRAPLLTRVGSAARLGHAFPRVPGYVHDVRQHHVYQRTPRRARGTGSVSTAGHPEYGPPTTVPQLPRLESAIVELGSVRHSEMKNLSDRLGRCRRFPWASAWMTRTSIRLGALVGGLLALIPFESEKPGHEARTSYFLLLAAVVVVTIVSAIATLTTHTERAESIKAIKDDFDANVLGTFEMPHTVDPSTP